MTSLRTPKSKGMQFAKLWLDFKGTFPIKVLDLAVEFTRDCADPIGIIEPHGIAGIDGMLSKRRKHADWCISYDASVSIVGRINFTLAHELGHYLLHRDLKDRFECSQGDMLDYDSMLSRKLEAEANVFASYLLMPINDFRMQVEGQRVNLDLLGHCANRYETSFTATALKWLEFTEEAAMLVVADYDNFICWSFCSEAARRIGAYIPPGTELKESTANYLDRCLTARNDSRRVGPGVWHSSHDAEESVIVSDQFEKNIFLIRFPHALSPDHDEEISEDTFDRFSGLANGGGWKK